MASYARRSESQRKKIIDAIHEAEASCPADWNLGDLITTLGREVARLEKKKASSIVDPDARFRQTT